MNTVRIILFVLAAVVAFAGVMAWITVPQAALGWLCLVALAWASAS